MSTFAGARAVCWSAAAVCRSNTVCRSKHDVCQSTSGLPVWGRLNLTYKSIYESYKLTYKSTYMYLGTYKSSAHHSR